MTKRTDQEKAIQYTFKCPTPAPLPPPSATASKILVVRSLVKRKVFALTAIFFLFLCIVLSAQAQVSFTTSYFYPGSGTLFAGDFNGDGKVDLLTSDGTMNLGNGDGSFTSGPKAPVPTVPAGYYVMAVADFSGDGKPDLLEEDLDTNSLLSYLGNGDATFLTTPISTSIGVGLTLVSAADLNADGRADVVGISNGTLFAYLSTANGFVPSVSYNIGDSYALLSLEDFNGDHKTDIVISATGQEISLLGNGDGTFQSAMISAGASSTSDAAAGDFNGDGKLDLALDGVVLLGNGDGTFQAPISSGASGVAGDINGDGKLDLVGGTHIYLGNGDGTFSDSGHAYLTASHSNSVIAEFNGDDKLDIAMGDTVLLGNGDGTFKGSLLVGPLGGNEEWDVVAGDFNNNGSSDIAVASVNLVPIWMNNGIGQLSLTNTYTLQAGYDDTIVTGDFNGDGNLDLIMASDQINGSDFYVLRYSVLLGNGDGTFQPVTYPMGYATTPASPSVVVGDFNNDGKLDFAAGLADSLFLGNGDGTFAAPMQIGAEPIVSADFNGDGKVDIATYCAGPTNSGTALLFGDGDGTFQPPICPTSLQTISPQFTGDLNHDGKPDLISNLSDGSFQVALGKGDGTFTLLPSSPHYVVAIADLNGDGIPDVLYQDMGSNLTQTGVLLGIGDGTFGAATDIFAAGGRILVADMNADGRLDLVLIEQNWGGSGVLFNTTQSGFELTATVPSPAIIAAGKSADSTVNVISNFGFNKTVTLSCAGSLAGAACAFNPPSVANSSGSSALTITTSSSTAAGTYPIQVQGTAGSVVNSAVVSLVVQASPDFSFGPATGTDTSQTLTAGQTATFALALQPSASFTGAVNLTCSITPNVSAAPTCSLPPSVQITGSGSQSVSVTVETTARLQTSASAYIPPGSYRYVCALVLFGVAFLISLSRQRMWALARASALITVVLLAACGGNSGSHNSGGTPAGTYTTTITATSGNLRHSATLTLVVK